MIRIIIQMLIWAVMIIYLCCCSDKSTEPDDDNNEMRPQIHIFVTDTAYNPIKNAYIEMTFYLKDSTIAFTSNSRTNDYGYYYCTPAITANFLNNIAIHALKDGYISDTVSIEVLYNYQVFNLNFRLKPIGTLL